MEIDMNITSWSDKDLEFLCIPENHKITFDGFQYQWYHKIHGNRWDLHYINGFDNWKKPYGWLQAALYNWSKELSTRRIKSSATYFNEMKRTLALTKQVIEIGNNKKLKSKVKIKLIRELMPQETVQYIADILKISRQAVHRHL